MNQCPICDRFTADHLLDPCQDCARDREDQAEIDEQQAALEAFEFTCRGGCGETVHDENDFCGPCGASNADADRGDDMRKAAIEDGLVAHG